MRPSPLAVLGLTLAVALAWLGGLRTPAVGAGVLLLGLVAIAVLRGPWWLQVLTIGAAAHLGVRAWDRPLEVSATGFLPSSWPLLVVVLAALVSLLRDEGRRPRRPLPVVGHAVVWAAVLALAATGPAGWFLATFTFSVEGPEPGAYREAISFAAATSVLLVVAVLLLRLRWGTWSPAVPAGVGLLGQTGLVAAALRHTPGWPWPDPSYVEWAALLPTSWPAVVLLAVAAVTAVPGRRPGRVEPWTPDPVPSRSSA